MSKVSKLLNSKKKTKGWSEEAQCELLIVTIALVCGLLGGVLVLVGFTALGGV